MSDVASEEFWTINPRAMKLSIALFRGTCLWKDSKVFLAITQWKIRKETEA
jgi:hypothetical protein